MATVEKEVWDGYLWPVFSVARGLPESLVFVDNGAQLFGRKGRFPVWVCRLHLVGLPPQSCFAPFVCPAATLMSSLLGPRSLALGPGLVVAGQRFLHEVVGSSAVVFGRLHGL